MNNTKKERKIINRFKVTKQNANGMNVLIAKMPNTFKPNKIENIKKDIVINKKKVSEKDINGKLKESETYLV